MIVGVIPSWSVTSHLTSLTPSIEASADILESDLPFSLLNETKLEKNGGSECVASVSMMIDMVFGCVRVGAK